ncbi:MAG: mycothiol synthase [Nocardioidaceae bacterium]
MSQPRAVRPVPPEEFQWTAGEGAAAHLRRVVEAATAADGRAPLNEAALLQLRHRGLEGSTLLVCGDPALGFAWLHGDPASPEIDLVVAPEDRGGGVGCALAAAAAESAPDRATAWSHGNHPAAAALAATHGFGRVRDLWVMRRPLDVDLPALWTVDGIDVRTFRPGKDEEAFLALNAAAFAHHPEQGDLTRADLDERMAEPWFDPEGFFLAVTTDTSVTGEADEVVGFHWTKVHDERPPYGEVYVVGVSPRAQGGGLGRLLTLAGLHHLAARGLPEVILYVEADNAPAVAVYTRLGFAHADEDTDVMYARG